MNEDIHKAMRAKITSQMHMENQWEITGHWKSISFKLEIDYISFAEIM
jgi:hypothetical protein